MKREYNYQAFTPEEVEQGLVQDLLNYLVNHNSKCRSCFYEILVTTDSYCTIVKWVSVNYNMEEEADRFKFVPSNGSVLLNYEFPDGSYKNFYSEEEYEDTLKEWLQENPGWVKNQYGIWVNNIEDKSYEEYLKEKHTND